MSEIATWLTHFEFEDALLFIWLVIVTPLLQFLLGGALRDFNLGNLQAGIPNAALLGVIFVVSGILAVVCSLTRTPGDRDVQELNLGTGFGYAHLPMLAATGIILFLGFDLLGIERLSEAMPCGVFALFIVGLTAYRRLPILDFAVRRVLMTPFIILTTTIFSATIDPIFGGLREANFLQVIGNELGRFEFGLILAAALVYYLMFVFAPRVIAGAGGGWLQWGSRFVLYLAGLVLNIGLLRVVSV